MIPVESSYLLVFKICGRLRVEIARDSWFLDDGYYAYLGSARLMRPYSRILRHFTPAKRIRWHIDRVTSSYKTRPIAGILLYGVSEDSLYNAVFSSRMFEATIPKFGSTDRRNHFTHLFKISYFRVPDIFREIASIAENLGTYLVEFIFT
ncbi:MAG: DUF123 domain-containing protein [Sulfolobales archaeon]